MDAHITRVHRSGESHPCDECESVFRSATGLKYHRWKAHRSGNNGPQKDDPDHWMDKPFMCGHCSHTSGLLGNLKKHIVNIHKSLPVKVIDLREARKEAKKACQLEGVERGAELLVRKHKEWGAALLLRIDAANLTVP